MNNTDIERDRKKVARVKRHRLSHETTAGRRKLQRKYRRTQKQLAAREGEECVTPIGKDYKTRGWVTR